MQFVYLIIGLVVGFLVGWMVRGNRKNGREILRPAQDDKSGVQDDSGSGLSQAEKEKTQNIEKIKSYISTHESVTNTEIVALLGVSDATVVRYMDELEKAGVLRQVGKTGVDAHYEKVN